MFVPLTNNLLVRELHTLRLLLVRRLRRMCTAGLRGIFVADQPSNALKVHRVKSLLRFQKLGSVPRVSHNRDKNPRGTELLNG
jgi:hypothetical protein